MMDTKKGQHRNRRVDLDNAKGIFMFYVVVYHFFNGWILRQVIQDWPSSFWKNFFISYTYWHEKMSVPGFCFISGLLGKGFGKFYDGTNDSRNCIKLKQRWQSSVSMLLVGTFVIQLFDSAMNLLVVSFFGPKDVVVIADAAHAAKPITSFIPPTIFDYDFLETWYLVALFGWRLLTPVFMQMMRYPLATSLCLAFLHSHVAFEWSDHVQMRLFRYFPFYMAGLLLDKGVLDRVPKPLFWGSAGVTITLFFAYLVPDPESIFSIQYFDYDWSIRLHAILLFHYIYSAIVVVSILLMIRPLNFSLFPFGHANSTLAIYTWHWKVLEVMLWGYLPFSRGKVQLFESKPAFDYVQQSTSNKILSHNHPFMAILLLHLLSYFICIVLGSTWAWNLFRYVNDPNCEVLFVRDQNGSHDANENVPLLNGTERKDCNSDNYDFESALPSIHRESRPHLSIGNLEVISSLIG
jgi:hypothetical protein